MSKFIWMGLLTFSLCFAAQEERVDLDSLTEQMIEANLDTEVAPPSMLMLLLRKLSSPAFIIYTFYQKWKSKVQQLMSCQHSKKGLPLIK